VLSTTLRRDPPACALQLHRPARANHTQEAIMATSTFAKVTDGISHGLRDAGERIVDFKDDAARDLGKRVDALGAMMKKHPFMSIGIGLAAGYVLARVIHRD
jgi:ElaB/YqjD/DUF883 family membrane-anchored ribosome-binding protein